MAITSGLQVHDFLDTNITGARGSARAVVVDVFGISETVRALESFGLKVRKVAGDVIKQQAVAVIALARDAYVPIDTGALRDSGFVRGPYFHDDMIDVEMGFGPALSERRARGGQSGPEYAVPVHEMPNLEHAFGEWKYLQTPFMVIFGDFDTLGGREIWSRLEGASGSSAFGPGGVFD